MSVIDVSSFYQNGNRFPIQVTVTFMVIFCSGIVFCFLRRNPECLEYKNDYLGYCNFNFHCFCDPIDH